MYICMHVCTYVPTYICMYVPVHVYIYIYGRSLGGVPYIYIYVCVRTRIHTFMHAYIPHTHMHISRHTHKNKCVPILYTYPECVYVYARFCYTTVLVSMHIPCKDLSSALIEPVVFTLLTARFFPPPVPTLFRASVQAL